MKKTLVLLSLLSALALSLPGCGTSPAAQDAAPADTPQLTAQPQPPAQEAPDAPAAPTARPQRQDGERFRAVDSGRPGRV